jgi:hypothetical protein
MLKVELRFMQRPVTLSDSLDSRHDMLLLPYQIDIIPYANLKRSQFPARPMEPVPIHPEAFYINRYLLVQDHPRWQFV